MLEDLIDVAACGAVVLGPHVACDGFMRTCEVRVQTHTHIDHLRDFESSKGTQVIFASEPTKDLLCAERNADLPFRSNFVGLPYRIPCEVDHGTTTLVASGHMLGATQVVVELDSGTRVGYSGDFGWPLDEVIEVEALVLDGTYGSPESVREYTQGEAEEAFLALVGESLSRGPVNIVAHRGTVQRALQLVSGDFGAPLIGSDLLIREGEVYRSYGFAIDDITSVRSPAGREILRSGRYIRFFGTGDQRPNQDSDGVRLKLSAFMARSDDPVVRYSDRAYGIAMSNHADFNGTIEYVIATGATYVLVDNCRGGHAVELAAALEKLVRITARASAREPTLEWGK
jgi:putative mRNA 3-end processing factor